ncbi:MAG TPA: DUF1549 domain-containing protein, partial [Urbifossiella sp.]|nr:DUF1549 domain-containing protein [Urbifossiella sp.]
MWLPPRRSLPRHSGSASLLTAVLVVTLPLSARAADDEGVRLFEQKIRPVLVKHCYACHSAQARDAKKLKGGLSLDTAAGVAAGGESGPVLVKGKARDSLLMKSLRHDGPEMPPSGKLPADVIADFARWIDLGAPDPRGGVLAVRPKHAISVEEGRQWWAFRPLQPVAPPAGLNPIDGFVRQAQLAKGTKSNRPASREALIRRAYFDVVGLPPTEAQIDAFVNDRSPTAFETVVDGLLASPAYGERWARHWLDAARYAESGGYEFDGFRPGAYHYRDWVIRALNADLPYDRFLRMQLAGDLIQPDAIEGAAATGFLVAGPYPGQITSKTVERIRYDQLDDMLMTVGGSMLGLTLGCVRCHDHKYDPIPQQDYYALAAALARTTHGPRTLDLDHAATERAVEKHRADGAGLAAALRAFATKDLPPRFEAWKKTGLPTLPEPVRWNWLEPAALDAERSYLKELAGGVIAHDGLAGAVRTGRPRGRQPAGSGEHVRLTFHTHQPTLTALRLDAFADKALPQRGPGLNPDGSFQLAELTVTARPLDPSAKDAPRPLKLKAVSAAFEDKDQPLAHAVDGNPATAWVVKATAKADNAAVFAFDPPLAGFPNGTELLVELRFRDLGVGRLRVAASAEPGPPTWAGEVAPQHAAELRAIAGA